MESERRKTSSNLIIGAVNKKVFCYLCGSHISPDECAYSTITHDPRLPSTKLIDPCVSCNVYRESTKPSPPKRDLAKWIFFNPPFVELDFILVGLGERGKTVG